MCVASYVLLTTNNECCIVERVGWATLSFFTPPIYKHNMKWYNTPQICRNKSSHTRSETSPNQGTKINMATLQHYKLRLLLTFLKILHVFLCIPCITSTHARTIDTSHYLNSCKAYNVPSDIMSLTRHYAPSIANPDADPSHKASTWCCRPHKTHSRQPQSRPTPSLQIQQRGNRPKGLQGEEPSHEPRRTSTPLDTYRNGLDRYISCAGKTHFPYADAEQLMQSSHSLPARKFGTDCKPEGTLQVSPLKPETLAVLILEMRSKQNQIINAARTETDPPTNGERWHFNHKIKQTHLQVGCHRPPSSVAPHTKSQQHVQTKKPGKSRDYQHTPTPKEATKCKLGGTPPYRKQERTNDSYLKLLHSTNRQAKQATSGTIQPNCRREPNSRKRQQASEEPHDPPANCQGRLVKSSQETTPPLLETRTLIATENGEWPITTKHDPHCMQLASTC